METLSYIKFIVLAITIGVMIGCTKNGTETDIINTTPPEFHVVVVTDDNNTEKVAGATVQVYKTQEDLDAGSNIYLTKQTDANGEAAFTKDEIKDRGVYYVKAVKDAMAGNKQSQYLLLNDGVNYLFVKIQNP